MPWGGGDGEVEIKDHCLREGLKKFNSLYSPAPPFTENNFSDLHVVKRILYDMGKSSDTFNKVRTCGQHPCRMSRVRGHFYVLIFLHVSEHSEHIFDKKNYYFHGWRGGGYPFPPFRGKFHENN